MYKDDYRAALGKLAPSDAWKADTLRKMHALEDEQAQAADRVYEAKRAVPFLTTLRRAALPVALVLAVAIVPLTTLRGCGGSAPPMVSQEKSTGMDGAPRVGGTNGGADTFSGEQPEGSAPEENSAATATDNEAGEGTDTQGSTAARGPIAHSDLAVTIPADGSTQFLYGSENGGMGAGGIRVKTPDAAELLGSNPTLDLPAEEMPKALPVYRVILDDLEMYDVLQGTAGILGEELEQERETFAAEKIPQEALDAGVLWRAPHAFVDTKNKISLSLHQNEVHFYPYGEGHNALTEAPEGITGEALQQYYYDNYGAKLQPLENPALETTGSYSDSGDFYSDSTWYEAGGPEDTLETQLYNYSFKRIYMYIQEDTHALYVVNYMVAPEEIGVCSLRTLDEAKEALFSGAGWLNGSNEAGGYDDAGVNILHWELMYYASPLMDTIQPVYRFIIEDPEGDTPPMEDGAGDGKSVRYAYVPALQPEYLEDIPFQNSFN